MNKSVLLLSLVLFVCLDFVYSEETYPLRDKRQVIVVLPDPNGNKPCEPRKNVYQCPSSMPVAPSPPTTPQGSQPQTTTPSTGPTCTVVQAVNPPTTCDMDQTKICCNYTAPAITTTAGPTPQGASPPPPPAAMCVDPLPVAFKPGKCPGRQYVRRQGLFECVWDSNCSGNRKCCGGGSSCGYYFCVDPKF